MNRLFSIFLAAMFFSITSQAAEPTSERLENVYEVDSFIVNYSPSGQNLGRVLAALCPNCPTQTLTFDQNTVLEVGGQLRPIDEIRHKAEHSGTITVTNHEPDKIIKFNLY